MREFRADGHRGDQVDLHEALVEHDRVNGGDEWSIAGSLLGSKEIDAFHRRRHRR